MLDKLHRYYKNSLLVSERPNSSFYSNFHWFKDESSHRWLGLPFESIQHHELSLLKELLHYEFTASNQNHTVKMWYDFLFLNGKIPNSDGQASFRFIQFHLNGGEWEQKDIEEAMFGFLNPDSIVIWIDQTKGVIIEDESNQFISEKALQFLSQTLESDFFIKANFYCGKIQNLTSETPVLFKEESYFFQNAINLLPSDRVSNFEKSFPSILSTQLPQPLEEWIHRHLLAKIADEPEILTTVKRFLENNSNATLTAKQLYIHRNTLQYRLDKFTSKTGINLKDFNNAITVYLACLLNRQ